MNAGQVSNKIGAAPDGLFDGGSDSASDSAFSTLQAQFLSHVMHDQNSALGGSGSALGGFLVGADLGINSALKEMDDGEAKLIGGDKAMAVDPAPQIIRNASETSALITSLGSKQYLNVPNPAEDIYNTPAAQDAFKRLFEPKQDTVAAAY